MCAQRVHSRRTHVHTEGSCRPHDAEKIQQEKATIGPGASPATQTAAGAAGGRGRHRRALWPRPLCYVLFQSGRSPPGLGRRRRGPQRGLSADLRSSLSL